MIIAITGMIGSGKSTVSKYIREKGYFVFDCDDYNRELLKKGNPGYEFVYRNFPETFDGEELNKSKLAGIIFNDSSKKKMLESFLHPLIMEECFRQCSLYEISFAEVPLLFECGFEKYFDHNILVVTDRNIAHERLILRGLQSEDADLRINSQMAPELKISRADKIIYNNCGLKDLYESVDKILKELC